MDLGPRELFNKFEVEGDAHSVDQDNALIEQLLVGDFRIDELSQSFTRANEFDGLGGFSCRGREFVEHGKIEKLKFDVRRNAVGNILQQGSQKKVEALGGAPVD